VTFFHECRKILVRGGVLWLLSVAVLIVGLNQWGAHVRIGSQRAQLAEIRRGIARAVEAGDVTPRQVKDDLELLADQEALLDAEARMLAFPRSIQVGFQSLATVGSLPIALAAGLAFGSEFAWGTYRTLIAGGRRRRSILWSQYGAFCSVAIVAIAVSAIVAGTMSAVLHGGVWRPGGWVGLAASLGAVVIAILLWTAFGLLSAVLTRSPGGGVTVVAMLWVASYFMSFLGPGVRALSPANLAVELVVSDASKIVTSPFLLVSGVDARGMGAVAAMLALTGETILAGVTAMTWFTRQEIR
jgi:ABC-type transport system involved in multi-copper enzyme maturation permease subunit